MFLGEKREKTLCILSSVGHPLGQPVNTYIKNPISGQFSKESLCVGWGVRGGKDGEKKDSINMEKEKEAEKSRH